MQEFEKRVPIFQSECLSSGEHFLLQAEHRTHHLQPPQMTTTGKTRTSRLLCQQLHWCSDWIIKKQDSKAWWPTAGGQCYMLSREPQFIYIPHFISNPIPFKPQSLSKLQLVNLMSSLEISVATSHVWRSEDNLYESVLSSHCDFEAGSVLLLASASEWGSCLQPCSCLRHTPRFGLQTLSLAHYVTFNGKNWLCLLFWDLEGSSKYYMPFKVAQEEELWLK